jgi:hypothetical protein
MLIYEQMMLRLMQCKCQTASLTPGVLQSPLVAYPSIVRHEANEGSLNPRHHVYTIDYYPSAIRVIRLY